MRKITKLLGQERIKKLDDEQREAAQDFIIENWGRISGIGDTSFRAHKLYRATDFSWDPPTICFEIERHGSLCRGGTRAERQRWSIDLEKMEADCSTCGYRQIEPRAKGVRTKPLVEMVSKAIVNGKKSKHLTWFGEKEVRVNVLSIPGLDEGAYGMTMQGRRRRFRIQLAELLALNGWHKKSWSGDRFVLGAEN